MVKYYVAIYSGALLTVVAQLLLKKGAMIPDQSPCLKEAFFNRYVLSGYLLFLGVTVINLFALQKVKLIEMVVVIPLIHLLIILSSMWIFGEKLGRVHSYGIIFIIIGIVIFRLA